MRVTGTAGLNAGTIACSHVQQQAAWVLHNLLDALQEGHSLQAPCAHKTEKYRSDP